MKIHLESYGCSLNQADAAIIKALLSGHKFTSLAEAQVAIINTCAVKLTTEQRMLSRVGELKALGKKVVVCGCLPKVSLKKLEKLDVILVDSNSLQKIVEAVKCEEPRVFFSEVHENKISLPHCQDDSATAVVEISEGCLGNCSFCGTKKARGNLTSYPKKQILDYVSLLVKSEKKEILLTSQDTGAYGVDIGTSLPELVSEIVKIPGDFRVRIGMMNPYFVSKYSESFLRMFDNEKVYKFLHVPIQSGSDKILKSMKRVGTVDEFREIVKEARKISNMAVATDIIVAFPGETDDDFRKTMKLIEETRPDTVNISRFGPRPGTVASLMKKLPSEVSKKRSKELSIALKRILQESSKKDVGKTFRVLVTGETRDGKTLARTDNYKQVVLDKIAFGFVDVKITGSGVSYLKGKIINR